MFLEIFYDRAAAGAAPNSKLPPPKKNKKKLANQGLDKRMLVHKFNMLDMKNTLYRTIPNSISYNWQSIVKDITKVCHTKIKDPFCL